MQFFGGKILAGIQIKAVIGTVIAILSYLFGDWDGILAALVTMVIIDFGTGITRAAIFDKDLNSGKMYRGGAKKVGIFAIIAIANILDGVFDHSVILRDFTACYFIANEALSVLENWGGMGLPMPPKLKGMLTQLRGSNEDDKKGDEDGNK